MAQDTLKLQCAEADIDTLEIMPDTNTSDGDRQLWFASDEVSNGGRSSIYLNEDSARKLFNYLGVWLHQH